MKQILSTLVLVFFIQNTFAAGIAIVSGKISNTKAKTATLFYNTGLIGYIEQKETAPVDKLGNVQFTVSIAQPTEVHLLIEQQQTTFYIQPGDNFTLTTNYLDFDNALNFDGFGSSKNNLYNELTKKFYYGHERDLFTQYKKRSAEKLAFYCDSLLNEKMTFIAGFKQDIKPDDNFISFLKTDLKYENAASKMQYPGYWSYLNRKGDTLPDMPANYYDFLKQLSLTSDSLISNRTYCSFIEHVMYHYVSQLDKEAVTPLTLSEKVALARLIVKKDIIVQAYEAFLVQASLRQDEFKDAQNYYYAFMKKNPGSVYAPELTDFYNKTKSVSPGQPAPEFSITGADGKKHNLAEYKGKVIFLDFWASWCGPCIRELPYEKKLTQEYEGKNILFLYISIDEDAASWKKAIRDHGIKGTHLVDPDFNGATARAYNLVGVPSYFLIDKNGLIISNNPPRPSDEAELRKVLDGALAN